MRVVNLIPVFISVFLLCDAQHGQKPGRKIRLRDYEIKFGSWPLMEVTKLGKKSHHPQYAVKRPSIGGFIQNAIQSNIKTPHGIKVGQFPHIKFNGPPHGHHQGPPQPHFQHGPPNQHHQGPPQNHHQGPPQNHHQRPPPSKPQFFADFKAPGPKPFTPNGPPPPPGFTKSPNGNQPIRVFVRGPPQPLSQYGIKVEGQPLVIPQQQQQVSFSSVMGKAAYSGFFDKNTKTFNGYNIQSFPPGPPPGFRGPPPPPQPAQQSINQNQFSAPPLNFRPVGPPPPPPAIPFNNYGPPAQPIMGLPSNPPLYRHEMDKTPKVPPVIKIGNHPPSGYSMTHGEQQLITLKLPNVRMNKKMDVETLLRGAEYKFSSDLYSPFSRQDHFPIPKGFKKESKKLPDVGAIYTVNMVLQTPNISAPMNGSESPHFQKGMEEMHRIYDNNNKQSPLDSQVKLLGKLFTELQRLKPPKVLVEDDHSSQNSFRRDGPTGSDPFEGDLPPPPKPPKVDAPLMAVHIQSYTVPEPGSGDPDVLDSSRMFGLQGHRFEFGSTNEIINLMDTAQKAVGTRIPVDELGNNRREANHNLQEWIKSYVTLTRKMNQQAHQKGEGIANKSFRQGQYFMPGGDGTVPMDPKMFSQGASITNAGAVATYQG